MLTIDIRIKDKIAMRTGGEAFIVRDNSDYVINFTFDVEWAEETAKTARFVLQGGGYMDVPFTGSSVAVPVISTGRRVDVGVFAGNLRTTTSATLPLVPSIRSEGGAPVPPKDAVYDKLIALINSMGEISDDDIKQAVEDYLSANPIAAASMRVDSGYIQYSTDNGNTWVNLIAEADLKGDKGTPGKDGAGMDITGASVGQIVKISAVDDTGKPTAWEAINIPEQAHPDWNQNDNTQPDYVKNRPFYIGTRTVTVENATDDVLEGFPVFAVGDTVTVSVDGVKHSLVAYDDRGYATIGDTTSSVNSGEGQLGWQVYVEDDGAVWFYATDAHTVSYVVLEVVKIDKKYLPDDASDMKIRYSSADNSCAIVHGTYAEVVNKIINDVCPTVHVILIGNNNKTVYSATANYYHNTNIIEIIGSSLIFNVYPDNTIVLSD